MIRYVFYDPRRRRYVYGLNGFKTMLDCFKEILRRRERYAQSVSCDRRYKNMKGFKQYYLDSLSSSNLWKRMVVAKIKITKVG